jgi:hypothetical protein
MQKLFCVVISVLMLAACQPRQIDNSNSILFQQGKLTVTLTPAGAPVETPLSLQISSDQAFEIISADLIAINMYMGRIPLRFQKLITPAPLMQEQWQADFLLGACSDPAMLWQLKLTVLLADGTKLSINEQFNSSW